MLARLPRRAELCRAGGAGGSRGGAVAAVVAKVPKRQDDADAIGDPLAVLADGLRSPCRSSGWDHIGGGLLVLGRVQLSRPTRKR